MKRNILIATIIAVALSVSPIPTLAQVGALATIHGTCKDANGQPITGAEIVWKNQDNGHVYKLKTDKKGQYFSLGVDLGQYTITLSKDGKVLNEDKNFHVGSGDVPYDVDLKQMQEQSIQDTAKRSGVSEEEIKKQQEQAAKVEQYNVKVKDANTKLKEANDALQAQPPDYDKAIGILNQVAQVMPDEDVVWYHLGAAYLDSAKTQTDAAEKAKRNLEAYNDLQKAIDLKKAAIAKGPAAGPVGKPPATQAEENVRMAAYYDNLGSASARLGKVDDAANAYKQAAELDPQHAGMYYFNMGAILTNSATDANGKKAAAEAFDKAIQADPNRADAYYWKGSNLIALSTTDSSGKLSAPDGTAEAFQKYLELQPNGPHAEEAKQMLAALNQTVESSFGKQKSSTKKK